VEVTLDQWDLPYGADVVRFMDLGIRDADRVLMVCTANYVAKAEERKGGAGYEGMIVTGHVARATDTIKFVPIVRGNSGEPLVPGFLGQRLWLDFRDDGAFEERLEELLRELHGAPRYVKPPLGRNPFEGKEAAGSGPVEAGGQGASSMATGKAPSVSAAKGPEVTPAAPEANPASASSRPAAQAPSVSPVVEAAPASILEATASPPPLALSPLTVPTARLRRQGARWQVEPQEVRVQACEVPLGDGESLRLIQIPEGEFTMGSPPTELKRSNNEGPQHSVRLGGFKLGQTPVTQAQWAVVARWPRVELDLEPDPSGFKGRLRPVERVSWKQAIEFCRRLSQRTGSAFTLPSEAQWECACRAGTTTPFAFGATLTAELVNYDANYTYADGPKGEYREQTTPLGLFPANAWGLQDMHGNVWEWCLDHWHNNYEGAPSDGSAWLKPNASDEEPRLLRGGSWLDLPRYCRSAFRNRTLPVDAGSFIGFRVVCLPQDPALNP
jgi:formylglycine-generating enzyme required for sulfatase activity